MNDNGLNIKFIKEKIEAVSKRQSLKQLLNGTIIFLTSVFFTNLFLSIIEIAGVNSSIGRKILFFSGLIIISIVLIHQVILKILEYFGIFSKGDYKLIADKIGNHFSEIKDELVNVLQLSEENKNYFSIELIAASIESTRKKIQKYNFLEIVDFNSTKKLGIIATIFIVINLALFMIIPQLSWASFRIINYDREFSVAPTIMFEISPGDSVVTKGDGLKIKINIYGESVNELKIFSKNKEQAKYSVRKLFRKSNGLFEMGYEKVQNSFDYFIVTNGVKSKEYQIRVIDRPKIQTLRVKIISPAYSRLSISEQIDNGNITALVGSNVFIELTSNKEIKSGKLIFADSLIQKLNVTQKKAIASFRIEQNNSYKIQIIDQDNVSNIAPIEYFITATYDNYPLIELIEPIKDFRLDARSVVPIKIKIQDDYGFHKLLLNYRLSASQFENPWDKFKEINLRIPNDIKEYDLEYYWSFIDINPAIGDVYSFYMEVFDNDDVNGPKSSRTKIINVRIPSMEEIFDETESKQNEVADDLNKIMKEAEQLKKELEKISNELKTDKKDLTWNEKEKIQNSVEKFERLSEMIEDAKEQIKQVEKELSDNKLLSAETLKKYEELQNLLNELTSEEMKAAMKRLEDAMKSLKRDDSQKAFEDFKINEEMFQKSIERTINLLKRIQIEQKMDEVIKRTELINNELEELQKDLNNEAKQQDNISKQNELTRQLQELEKEFEKLSDKMKEFDDLPNKDMQKLKQEMEEQNNDEISKDIEKELNQGHNQQASKMQKQLMQNMKQNKQKLQQLQSSMQMQNQMNTMMQMMKALSGILNVSKEQEKLKEGNSSVNDKEIVKNQNQLRANLDRVINQLADLSNKTFAITPEMGKALGNAKANMNQAIQNLQSNNLADSKKAQQQSMKNLNEAASLLKGGMEQMMQNGGQGSGMMSLMQQMEKLSQQQMGLNQLTQKMQSGELSESEMGQLQRLAQQQEMIRKSLQELNNEAKESGQSKKLSANLDEILKEMKEVVNNLESEKLNDDVIKSQDKILSRMLDAQRSMNERDYEQKRESSAGRVFNRQSPEELKNIEKKTKLQEELQKALREGYKKDYEDLIRKYFESLEKK